MTRALANEVIAGLAPAARAFERAKRKGYAWVGESGAYETHEAQLAFTPAPPPNPNQLTLDQI
jgi:hypothetical protein